MTAARVFTDQADEPLLIVDELGAHRGVRRTPNGVGWVVPATLTRTGIFTYVEGGKVLRVLRAPEDVFHTDSIASLAQCPVTVYHPTERVVTGDNYRKVSVGWSTEAKRIRDKYLASDLIVMDGDTGARIDKGELSDISMGYRAEYARNADGSYESGTYQGESYDRKQINIRYNHVSLGPKGWGRAGTDVGVKLDASDSDYLTSMDNVFADQVFNDEADAKPAVTPVTAPAVTPAVQNDAAQISAERDREKARADMLQLQINTLLAAQPKQIDPAAVAARATLVADAKTLAPELVCDGLTDAQVKASALSVFTPDLVKNDGSQSQAYVDAAFDIAVKQRKSVVASHSAAAAVARAPITTQVVTDSVADAEKAMKTRHASAYDTYNEQASKLPAR